MAVQPILNQLIASSTSKVYKALKKEVETFKDFPLEVKFKVVWCRQNFITENLNV